MKNIAILSAAFSLLIAMVAINVNADEHATSQSGTLDSKTMGSGVRASKLIGMNIENSQQKSVGEINDIVLNSKTGEIEYVAVTYGGFLGVGNKMFAVPFEAIKCKADPDDQDEHILVLNVTQKHLEGATGFDEDHWPNFADKSFTDDLYKRYGVKRRADVSSTRMKLDK